MTSNPITARDEQPNAAEEAAVAAHAALVAADPKIDRALLVMSDAEVANVAYDAQTTLADLQAEFDAAVAKIRARKADARAIIEYRMSQHKMTAMPHARLDVRMISSPARRTQDVDRLVRIKRAHPEVQWAGAIDEVEVPATVETKTNLTKLNKIIKDLGESPLAKELLAATPSIPGAALLKITLRDDAPQKVDAA